MLLPNIGILINAISNFLWISFQSASSFLILKPNFEAFTFEDRPKFTKTLKFRPLSYMVVNNQWVIMLLLNNLVKEMFFLLWVPHINCIYERYNTDVHTHAHMHTSNTIRCMDIANRSRWKSFTVVELNCNSLENVHSWMVVCMAKADYFTGKVYWLPIDLQKLQNFSTSNDFQYTVE